MINGIDYEEVSIEYAEIDYTEIETGADVETEKIKYIDISASTDISALTDISASADNDLNITNLANLNKKSLHDKLAAVESKKLKSGGTAYKANDMIDVLSMNKVRDKRLINDYSAKEIIVLKSRCGDYNRNSRFFTLAGISRYLLEGKIFSYANACEFFKIKQQNIEYIKWDKQLNDMESDIENESENENKNENKDTSAKQYNTKAILKWLFDKRKSCKVLGEEINIRDILAFFGDDATVNTEKIKYLKTKINIK